jgi:RNA-binding protein FUS
LPKTVTVQDLEEKFGMIGVIKIDKKTNQPKIWIYKDKNTGEGKGEATVTYDDEEAASAAIKWFNGLLKSFF